MAELGRGRDKSVNTMWAVVSLVPGVHPVEIDVSLCRRRSDCSHEAAIALRLAPPPFGSTLYESQFLVAAAPLKHIWSIGIVARSVENPLSIRALPRPARVAQNLEGHAAPWLTKLPAGNAEALAPVSSDSPRLLPVSS